MDKCALITGATRGIGKQIAITLAKQGYNIALNYRKENEELENTKKEIEKMLNEIKERPHRSKFKQLWDTYHGDNSK